MTRRLWMTLICLLALSAPVSAQVSGPWAKVVFGSDTGPVLTSGSGSPEGVVSAPVGSVYLRSDGGSGTSVYFKESGTGSSGWVGAGSGGGGSTHNLLGTTHTDTSTAAALRGALVIGNSTPAWSRLAIGSAGSFVRSDGTDVSWGTNGSALTALNASNVSSGTLGDGFLSANVSLLGSSIGTSEIEDDAITVAKIAQNGCTSNQILKWNGADWACATDEAGGGGSAHATLSVTHTDTNPGTLVEGDLLVPNSSNLLDRLPVGSEGEVLTVVSGVPEWASAGVSFGNRSIGITIDGAGEDITTGVKGFVYVPFAGTITEATLASTDASATSCSIVIDVWQDTHANYPPTDADSVTASAPPTLSSANKSQDTTLTGWSTTVTSGRWWGFAVDSNTGCTRVTLVLTVEP